MSAGEQAPCLGIIEAVWQRNEVQTETASNSGEADIIEIGDPFWSIEVKVNIKDRAHFDDWEAFLARRRLQDLTFTMWRTFRPNPRDTSISSDTGLGVSSINVANSTITLSGYGAGKKAHPGDMISYITAGDGYWIGQATAEATADGSGVITIPVWPRPVTANATPLPRRIQALGEFRLSGSPRIREGHKNWSIDFEAQQVLR